MQMNSQEVLSRSQGASCPENGSQQPRVTSRGMGDGQGLSHFKTNRALQAVITPIHYLSLGPPDACAYGGTLL